jgi:hypothetical protein
VCFIGQTSVLSAKEAIAQLPHLADMKSLDDIPKELRQYAETTIHLVLGSHK